MYVSSSGKGKHKQCKNNKENTARKNCGILLEKRLQRKKSAFHAGDITGGVYLNIAGGGHFGQTGHAHNVTAKGN